MITLPVHAQLQADADTLAAQIQTRTYAVAQDKVAKFKGQKGSDGNYTVSLIEGDGIGPEISQAVKDIYSAAQVPIKWEPVDVTPQLKDGKTVIPDSAIESIQRNYVALKGPLAVCLGAWTEETETLTGDADSHWQRTC